MLDLSKISMSYKGQLAPVEYLCMLSKRTPDIIKKFIVGVEDGRRECGER